VNRQSWEIPQSLNKGAPDEAALNLRGQKLNALPTPLKQLNHLQVLLLGLNRLSRLPREIGTLSNLIYLELRSNRLTELPPELGQLHNLKTLDLHDNRLTAVPPELSNLYNLKTLDLHDNQLTAVPPELSQLTNLEKLDLRDNRLTALPRELGQLTKLQRLSLDGNPLPEPIPELNKKGAAAVLAYLRSLKDVRVQYEAKMVLVGEGAVGKTSLVARLHGDQFVVDRQRTHGIELSQLKIRHPKKPVDVIVNVWDFGGQDIYQATHQLFLTSRALYLVVWNARAGPTAGRVEDWIRRIRLQVGDEAQILLVATHADQSRTDIDYEAFKRKYGAILVGLHEVDSRTRKAIDPLRRAIAEQIAAIVPEEGQNIGQQWIDVRKALTRRPEPQLSYQQVVALGASHGVEEAQVSTLLGLLHEKGLLIHYTRDWWLRDVVVLQPDWLTRAISAVLDDPVTEKAGGMLEHSRLRGLWQDQPPDKSYPVASHPYLLRMMEAFDISYRLDSEYSLIGQRVPSGQPDLPWTLDDEPPPKMRALSVVCRLSEPVAGLMPWLIVRNHDYAMNLHWQQGTFLRMPQHKSEALLCLIDDRQLAMTVHAPFPEYFFHVLLGSVETLIRHRWRGLSYELAVPCRGLHENGERCRNQFTLKALRRHHANRDNNLVCQECGKRHDLALLIAGFQNSPSRSEDARELLSLVREIKDDTQQIKATGVRISAATATIADQLRIVLKALTSDQERRDGCPRLFSLRPKNKRGLKKAAVWQDSFWLTLWCEQPTEEHPWPTARYEFDQSREWFMTLAPYGRLICHLLTQATSIAAVALNVLPSDMTVRNLRDEVELTREVFSLLLPHMKSESLSGVGLTNGPTAAEGAGLRALRSLLEELDKRRFFGGLDVVATPSGEFLWVCPNHQARHKGTHIASPL
jgi:internalin A